jgi:hypothetical protein
MKERTCFCEQRTRRRDIWDAMNSWRYYTLPTLGVRVLLHIASLSMSIVDWRLAIGLAFWLFWFWLPPFGMLRGTRTRYTRTVRGPHQFGAWAGPGGALPSVQY